MTELPNTYWETLATGPNADYTYWILVKDACKVIVKMGDYDVTIWKPFWFKNHKNQRKNHFYPLMTI